MFRTAADHGLPAGSKGLAGCYHRGQGVEQNYALAAAWLRKLADQPGDYGGQFFVGRICALGEGVKKDLPLGKRSARCALPCIEASHCADYISAW